MAVAMTRTSGSARGGGAGHNGSGGVIVLSNFHKKSKKPEASLSLALSLTQISFLLALHYIRHVCISFSKFNGKARIPHEESQSEPLLSKPHTNAIQQLQLGY